MDGHPITVTVRGIVGTEINPSIANHGPIVNSILMPVDQVQSLLNRPGQANIVFLHNQGPGGVADLGPGGATGDEVTRHMRAAFTDQQSAAELKAYLSTPAIKAQVAKLRDDASFLDPDKQLADKLLVELNKPGVTDEFKSLFKRLPVEGHTLSRTSFFRGRVSGRSDRCGWISALNDRPSQVSLFER